MSGLKVSHKGARDKIAESSVNDGLLSMFFDGYALDSAISSHLFV